MIRSRRAAASGLMTYPMRAAALAAEHGERLGIEAIGCPTSWAHTRSEIEKMSRLLQEQVAS